MSTFLWGVIGFIGAILFLMLCNCGGYWFRRGTLRAEREAP